MTGPTGADQQTPDRRSADDWDQVLADQVDLYADRARRRREIEPETPDSPRPPAG